MKAILLAAGYATRLYPLTENFPKPLLTIKDKTILDWLIEDLNVEEYVVISNHKFAHHFEEWAKHSAKKITVVDDGTETNETRLGAVKDVEYAIEKLNIRDDCLVVAGDNVLDFSLNDFLDYAAEQGTSCTMRYFEPDTEKLKKCGVLELDGDRIVGMEEKPAQPKTNWCCPPFYFYKKEDIARIGEAIADGCGVDAPGSLVAWLCRRAPVHAMVMPGKRYDVGNLESYRMIQNTFEGRRD